MFQKPIVRTIFAISIGAVLGALSRHYLGLEIADRLTTGKPYATLIINLTGCFGMGFLMVLFLTPMMSLYPELRLLLITGFLGSYTTFSSYELDSAKLLESHQLESDLFYWMGSVIFGLISLQLGSLLAEWLLKKRRRNLLS